MNELCNDDLPATCEDTITPTFFSLGYSHMHDVSYLEHSSSPKVNSAAVEGYDGRI